MEKLFIIHIYLSEAFYFLHFSTLYVVVAMPFTTMAVDYNTVGTLVESNAESCLKFLCSNEGMQWFFIRDMDKYHPTFRQIDLQYLLTPEWQGRRLVKVYSFKCKWIHLKKQ